MTTFGAFTLYPHQESGVEALRENFRRGVRQQMLCSPTGSGKTVMAMAMIDGAFRKGKRVAFVCDRQTLVTQTSERLHEAKIPHGILMGDNTMGVSQPVRVCSAQTLESRGFHAVDLLIIDEAHEQRKKVLEHVRALDVRTIGLSATPMSKGLGKTYKAVVNVATTSDLIRDGFLAPLKVIGPESTVDVEGLQAGSNGEWARDDVSARTLRIVGDVVPEWERVRTELFGGELVPTIAFAATVADSEALAEEFGRHGYDFRVVSYRQSSEEKDAIIAGYRAGHCVGLVSCAALSRGFDAPETAIMIDAYPLRSSLITELQRLGRVMRTAEGKQYGVVIDHAENWLAFGPQIHAFYDRGVDSLDDAEEKKKAVRDEGAMEERRKDSVCSACRTILPPGAEACPTCGKPRPKRQGANIDRVSGSMGVVDEVDGRGRELPYSGDWWEELCAVASAITEEDDRARRIALAKYRQVFGRWPPRGREFERVDRPPHPDVAKYTRRQFQRWKIAQQKAQEKEAAAG